MNPTFNTQPIASSVNGTVLSGRTELPAAEKVFTERISGNQADSTTADQQAAVVTISAQGAKRAEVAASSPANGDAAAEVTPQPSQTAASAPADARAPASAAGASGGAGGSQAASGASSASKTYEPADTDQDGTVSPKEQAAYDAKLAADKAATQAADSARSAEANAAVKAYESVEQLGKDDAA